MKVTVKAYDGSLVYIEKDKVEEYKAMQEKIKKLISEGKTKEEALQILKNSEK